MSPANDLAHWRRAAAVRRANLYLLLLPALLLAAALTR